MTLELLFLVFFWGFGWMGNSKEQEIYNLEMWMGDVELERILSENRFHMGVLVVFLIIKFGTLLARVFYKPHKCAQIKRA